MEITSLDYFNTHTDEQIKADFERFLMMALHPIPEMRIIPKGKSSLETPIVRMSHKGGSDLTTEMTNILEACFYFKKESKLLTWTQAEACRLRYEEQLSWRKIGKKMRIKDWHITRGYCNQAINSMIRAMKEDACIEGLISA